MSKPCAIIGADIVTALGADLDRVWTAMLGGECGIRPMRRLDASRYRTGVAGEFPEEVEGDLGLGNGSRAFGTASHVARRVLASAGCDTSGMGLVVSTTKAEIEALEAAVTGEGAALRGGRHLPPRFTADLAAALGIDGPAVTVSTACASGLAAMGQAARMIERGDIETALVVGVDTLAHFVVGGFSSLASLSAVPCRPFDAGRDGLSLGEGAGAMVIAKATTGAQPVGYLRGWGSANDANHITGPSRTGEGLKRAIRQALDMAGIGTGDIQYISAHGTGTVYNDEMEAQAINGVFGDEPPPATSMKGYFGHTLGAAGVVEAALCLRALSENTIPGSLGLSELGVTKPMHIPAEAHPIQDLRTVLCMKSGFGGVNAAVVLSTEAGS
ncbi:MAG: beta-ketoacyl-[acyl-carrier-protein] synthase family protein [bacterium]|nr:beta-ketoacyl-[acyl-carrier-protein] synthase family protein [bacterium]